MSDLKVSFERTCHEADGEKEKIKEHICLEHVSVASIEGTLTIIVKIREQRSMSGERVLKYPDGIIISGNINGLNTYYKMKKRYNATDSEKDARHLLISISSYIRKERRNNRQRAHLLKKSKVKHHELVRF